MTDVGSKQGVREALIGKAEALLDVCRIERTPVDLLRIARHLGIQRIRELDVRLDGQLLELADGTYEVILSKGAPHTRKRFTLAHEIGHLLVAAEGDGDVTCGDGVTEEMCNSVAAELLLPSRFLAGAVPDRMDVSAIRQIASRFQCSLEATGWRILNLGAATGALLIWRDAGEDSMELIAAPRTFGFTVPFASGEVLDKKISPVGRDGGQTSGPVDLKDPKTGKLYTGDYLQLNKTLLVFIQAALGAIDCKVAKAGGEWIQGKLF